MSHSAVGSHRFLAAAVQRFVIFAGLRTIMLGWANPNFHRHYGGPTPACAASSPGLEDLQAPALYSTIQQCSPHTYQLQCRQRRWQSDSCSSVPALPRRSVLRTNSLQRRPERHSACKNCTT